MSAVHWVDASGSRTVVPPSEHPAEIRVIGVRATGGRKAARCSGSLGRRSRDSPSATHRRSARPAAQIEPVIDGVSMMTRGERLRAASRLSTAVPLWRGCPAALAGTVRLRRRCRGAGAGGRRRPAAAARPPGPAGLGGRSLRAAASAAARQEVLPADQHRDRQHDGEQRSFFCHDERSSTSPSRDGGSAGAGSALRPRSRLLTTEGAAQSRSGGIAQQISRRPITTRSTSSDA